MKRIAAILLATALFISFVACSGASDTNTEITTAAETEAVTETDTEKEYPHYGNCDFNGKNYHILNCQKNQWNMYTTIVATELVGEAVNDAVFERNARIIQKLNLTMSEENYTTNDSTFINKLSTAILAGDDCYDIACVPMYQSTAGMIEGHYFNLDTLESIHLDKNWWNQTMLAETSINNRHYLANSSVHLMFIDAIWCLYFNKDILKDNGMEQPYDLVREGNWTYDAYQKYLSAATMLNGDESFAWNSDGNCVYGVSSHGGMIDRYLFGMNAHFIEKDKNDQLIFTADSELFTNVYQLLANSLSQPGVCLIANSEGFHYSKNIFINNRAAFIGAELKEGQVLRDMESEFGIIPYPKYNEEQPDYHSTVVRKASSIAIPITQKIPEDSALLLDALSFESEDVEKLFIEVRIEQKGLRDEDSIEMLHIMLNTVGIDLGVGFYIIGNLWNSVLSAIPAGNTDITSMVETYRGSILAEIEKLAEI